MPRIRHRPTVRITPSRERHFYSHLCSDRRRNFRAMSESAAILPAGRVWALFHREAMPLETWSAPGYSCRKTRFQPGFRLKNGAGFLCAILLFHASELFNCCIPLSGMVAIAKRGASPAGVASPDPLPGTVGWCRLLCSGPLPSPELVFRLETCYSIWFTARCGV